MTNTDRYFLIKDLNCIITVEKATRKEMLYIIDNYIENIENGLADDEEVFTILYKDGTTKRIDIEFDEKNYKKINIASIVFDNPCTYMVYGNFEIDNEGVINPAFEEEVATENIEEVATENIKEIKPIEKEEEKEIMTNKAMEIEGQKTIIYNPALTMKIVKKIVNDLISDINLNKIKVDYIHILKNNKGIIKENTGQQILINYFTYNNEGLENYYKIRVKKTY